MLQGMRFLQEGDSEHAYESFRRVLLLDVHTESSMLVPGDVSEAYFNLAVALQVNRL